MTDSDYLEISCCKCGTIHWIPLSLWDTMLMTRNDNYPISAHCPYGHGYAATADKKEEFVPPAPVPRKKPRRFWERKEKNENQDNVIKLKDRK